jgi:hypothetical protein
MRSPDPIVTDMHPIRVTEKTELQLACNPSVTGKSELQLTFNPCVTEKISVAISVEGKCNWCNPCVSRKIPFATHVQLICHTNHVANLTVLKFNEL